MTILQVVCSSKLSLAATSQVGINGAYALAVAADNERHLYWPTNHAPALEQGKRAAYPSTATPLVVINTSKQNLAIEMHKNISLGMFISLKVYNGISAIR